MAQQETSALAQFGVTQWPIGTTEEVKRAGYNPRTTSSCCGGDEAKALGLRPCPVYDTCRFNLANMGGFKDSGGPRYIAFRFYDPSEPGSAGQDVQTCFNWTLTQQKKADANAALRRTSGGKHGAVIRVIAQEGEEYRWRGQMPVNGNGEVINPMPELMEDMKKNNIKVSTVPGQNPVAWRFFEMNRIVPRFPRPGEARADSWDHKIAMLDQEADQHDINQADYGMPEMPPLPADQPAKARNPWGRAGKPKDEPS